MLSMVQDKVMLIPHINLVIPEEFDMVEFKVFLFFVLLKDILNLKQVLVLFMFESQLYFYILGPTSLLDY